MPKVNLLRDVEPTILTLCKKGANGKRYFLMKSAEELKNEDLVTLPGQSLVKAADWSTVYCVVAEPEAEEDPGVGDGAGSGVMDLWKSEEEIRKAAHYFAKSDRLITGLHGTMEPFGVLVENAVAHSDFTIDGPDGEPHTIKKGSWYVAIEPTPDGKAAIEAGEFTGISLEGTGVRELVDLQKSEDEKLTMWKRLGQMLGVSPHEGSATLSTETREEDDEDMADIQELETKVEDIAKAQGAATTAIEGLIGTVNGLVERLDAKNTAKDDEDEGSKPADLKKSLTEVTETLMKVAGKLDQVEAQVEAIADSGSTQDDDDKADLKKSAKSDFWGAGIL